MNIERVAEYSPVRIVDEKREAAVIAPVLNRQDEPHILFTKRAEHLGEHPGQMSFPGGGREPVDDTLYETALREAWEEIGLRSTEVNQIGRLDDIRTVTRYSVTPYVVRIPDRIYEPDEREVAEVAVIAVSDLIDPENYETKHREHPYYGNIVIHYFHVDDYTVWGATARILVQLLELTTDWRAPERINRLIDTDQ